MNVNSKNELAFTGNWVIDAIKLGKERVPELLNSTDEKEVIAATLLKYKVKNPELHKEVLEYLSKIIRKYNEFQIQKYPTEIRLLCLFISYIYNKKTDNIIIDENKKEIIIKELATFEEEEIREILDEKGILNFSKINSKKIDTILKKIFKDQLISLNNKNIKEAKNYVFFRVRKGENNLKIIDLIYQITDEEKSLFQKLKELKKEDFVNLNSFSQKIFSVSHNVKILPEFIFKTNIKLLPLFKSKQNEPFFSFIQEDKFYLLEDKKNYKYFKIIMPMINKDFLFIHHHDKMVTLYANKILERLIDEKMTNKKDNDNINRYYSLFKEALIKTLVKFLTKASLFDFTFYVYHDQNQRVKKSFSITFDLLSVNYFKRFRNALSKKVIIGFKKNKNINILIYDFLPFALMKLSPTRLLLNQLLFEKTNKDPYLIYLLYKFYSLKNQNINEGVSESHYEINKYMYFSEIRNPFSYDNQVKEDKESLSYENFEEFKTIINDDKDREYVLSAVVKNNKAAFLNFVIKKIITDRNLLNDKIIKNMFKEDDTWMYLGAFVVIG